MLLWDDQTKVLKLHCLVSADRDRRQWTPDNTSPSKKTPKTTQYSFKRNLNSLVLLSSSCWYNYEKTKQEEKKAYNTEEWFSFTKSHLNKPWIFWKNVLWDQMRPRWMFDRDAPLSIKTKYQLLSSMEVEGWWFGLLVLQLQDQMPGSSWIDRVKCDAVCLTMSFIEALTLVYHQWINESWQLRIRLISMAAVRVQLLFLLMSWYEKGSFYMGLYCSLIIASFHVNLHLSHPGLCDAGNSPATVF